MGEECKRKICIEKIVLVLQSQNKFDESDLRCNDGFNPERIAIV